MIKKFLILLIIFITNITVSFANKTEQINVAFTIDNNYPIFALLSINSILKNNVSNSNYTFYIVENNLTNKNKKKMETFVKKRNQNIEFININEPLLTLDVYKHKYSSHVTEIGMARIYLPDLLPKEVEKVLYLDADTLILTDLKDLYNEKLDNYIAGMVLDIDDNVDFENKIYLFKKDYFNSGVILINLKKAREEKSTQKFIDYFNNVMLPIINGGDVNKYRYPDQDLINIVWKDKIKKLHYKWNMQGVCLNENGIIHYVTRSKPWEFIPYWYDNSILPREIYIKYWDECSDLRFYRYYYVLKSIYRDYLILVSRKCNHCKKIFKLN